VGVSCDENGSDCSRDTHVIFPTHFAMGLIFRWLRMRTGSLLPGMVLHGSWSAVIILLELNR